MPRIHLVCAALPGLLISCGGGDSADLFTRSAESGPAGASAGGSDVAGASGFPTGTGGVRAGSGSATSSGMGGTDPGGASQGGTGGAGAFSTGGFAGVPIGTGGATGGSAGAFGTGGVAGSAGSTGTGGTPPSLPTGTKGFPTNAAECPPELPPSGTSCLLGLACQYPGMLCTCGFDYQMQCTSQQNQCLDQSHCTAGLCHPALHVCTECVDNTHCLDSARPMCRADGVCVQCLTNAECSSFTPICNIIPFSPLVNTCVQCMQDTDCPGDEVCESFFGFCQSPSG